MNLSSVISQHSSLVTQLTKRSYARLPSVNDFNDIKKIISHEMTDGRLETILPCPKECDVLIIGGKKNTDSLLHFRLLSMSSFILMSVAHRREAVLMICVANTIFRDKTGTHICCVMCNNQLYLNTTEITW